MLILVALRNWEIFFPVLYNLIKKILKETLHFWRKVRVRINIEKIYVEGGECHC